jgi:hypothetical protein
MEGVGVWYEKQQRHLYANLIWTPAHADDILLYFRKDLKQAILSRSTFIAFNVSAAKE